jgi:hypothetical protein
LYIVISRREATWDGAYRAARHELARFQSRMRVADTRFRWESPGYFYWTNRAVDDRMADLPDAAWAFPRDSSFLTAPFPLDYVQQVYQWMDAPAAAGEVRDAVAASLYWQGLAYHEDALESSIISWWIPVERLGGGSYDYKDVIGRLGGWLWHWGMWSTSDRPWQGFYQDQQRMRRLLGKLGKLRNKVVHRGTFPSNVDGHYVEWLLQHLAHDLTVILVQLNREHGIATFDALLRWLDGQMGFGG